MREMSYRIREKIFNKIMVKIRRFLYSILNLDRYEKYEADILVER